MSRTNFLFLHPHSCHFLFPFSPPLLHSLTLRLIFHPFHAALTLVSFFSRAKIPLTQILAIFQKMNFYVRKFWFQSTRINLKVNDDSWTKSQIRRLERSRIDGLIWRKRKKIFPYDASTPPPLPGVPPSSSGVNLWRLRIEKDGNDIENNTRTIVFCRPKRASFSSLKVTLLSYFLTVFLAKKNCSSCRRIHWTDFFRLLCFCKKY